MKKTKKIIFITLLLSIFIVVFGLVGCSNNSTNNQVYVLSIIKTDTVGLVDTYTITYSDGTTSTFEITNGGNGIDGVDGENLDIDEIYAKYLELYPNTTYEDFLKKVLSVNTDGNATAINKALKSSAKIYTEFTQSYRLNFNQTTKETAIYLGSAVVYKIDSEFTYFITNYHVIYNSSATEQDKIAKKIVVYLYGSESEPVSTNTKGADGCTVYNYGEYGIECEYVGGSITTDIAIVKAKNSIVNNVNEDISPITFAKDYHVGETAIAIGNPEGEGLSVTEGIISVDNEDIALAIDGKTTRNYRSIRIDTSIYSGSSGGGLFNTDGKLIGITNAGDGEDQNVNYAIPVEIVKSAVENIMFYAENGEKNAKKITLGITATSSNSKYVYNETLGYGEIIENVYISTVNDNSISQSMGLASGDRIISVTINGNSQIINRYFEIGDILLQIRSGDVISINYERAGAIAVSSSYTVENIDLSVIA